MKLADLLENLEKFECKGKFFLSTNDRLNIVCNIPDRKDYSGLYIFYSESKEIVYVGISGREDTNGCIIHRKDGLRGRILKGKQFGNRRIISLPIQMKLDGISILEIHWFVTYGDNAEEVPRPIEIAIIKAFEEENNGKKPKWNRRG